MLFFYVRWIRPNSNTVQRGNNKKPPSVSSVAANELSPLLEQSKQVLSIGEGLQKEGPPSPPGGGEEKQVRMAERSKALRSGRSPLLWAWVRIPLLTIYF